MLKINKVVFLDLQLMFCKLAPVKHRNSPVEVFFCRQKISKGNWGEFFCQSQQLKEVERAADDHSSHVAFYFLDRNVKVSYIGLLQSGELAV